MSCFPAIGSEKYGLSQIFWLVDLIKDTQHYRGINVQSYSTTLSIAVSTGDAEIVQMLIKFGFAPNHAYYIGGKMPLERAVEMQEISMVTYLLDSGANPNLGGCATTPLICAVLSGNSRIVRVLMERGACVNTSAEGGFTPLMAACLTGNLRMVRLLIEFGADPNEMTTDGETALLKAAEYAKQYVFEYLLPLTNSTKQREMAKRLLEEKTKIVQGERRSEGINETEFSIILSALEANNSDSQIHWFITLQRNT